MANYRLTIQYDGGRYKGWQRLGRGENTIQGKLENESQSLSVWIQKLLAAAEPMPEFMPYARWLTSIPISSLPRKKSWIILYDIFLRI